jgi:phosphonate transport system substrate-binding protein
MDARRSGAGGMGFRMTWLRIAWAALALASVGAHAQEPAPPAQEVLVLGRISDDPKQHYEALRPLLDYVVPRMKDVGIREGRVLMARDAQQMMSYLRRHRVDWLTETPAMAVAYRERAGAQILLSTERGGGDFYHTVFFVRRDSGIRTLQDLKGRSIAFQNLYSTSSYIAPAAELLGVGLHLDLLLSPMDRPEPDSVGYLFARSEANISTWVHKRLVDAGAFANLDWSDLHRLPESFREDLMVIHETEPFPRAVEVVRPGLDPRIQARLKEVLLQARDDPEARVAMLSFFGTNGFKPLDAAAEASLERLAVGVRNVRAELE